MTEETHPLASLTDAGLDALLKRAIRIIVIFGVLASLAVWKASGWRNAAMLATGTAISAASILEWQRLIHFINAKLDQKQAPRGAAVAALFFVFRLILFAGAIYGSLKCFRGSVIALLCGLGLAVLAIFWEAIRLLRN
ncbi:MAG TPA: hypothetical protein VGF96_17640 [Terracidiphilus sp.]|jgi:hypothetical protein